MLYAAISNILNAWNICNFIIHKNHRQICGFENFNTETTKLGVCGGVKSVGDSNSTKKSNFCKMRTFWCLTLRRNCLKVRHQIALN